MDDKNALDCLRDFFEKNGWPLGLTPMKFTDRAYTSNIPDDNGWHIVKIERHRGILGARYIKGCPMAAFEIYNMCYAVNLDNGEIEERHDEFIKNDINLYDIIDERINIDFGSDCFDLRIESAGDGKYNIDDLVSNNSDIVSSIEETNDFIFNMTEGWDELFREKLVASDLLTEKQIIKIINDYNKSLKEKIHSIANNIWDERDLQ